MADTNGKTYAQQGGAGKLVDNLVLDYKALNDGFNSMVNKVTGAVGIPPLYTHYAADEYAQQTSTNQAQYDANQQGAAVAEDNGAVGTALMQIPQGLGYAADDAADSLFSLSTLIFAGVVVGAGVLVYFKGPAMVKALVGG